MRQNKQKAPRQTEFYEKLQIMSVEELKSWYESYVCGYPTHVAPMIKHIAVLRGFDVSDWKGFSR